MLQVGEVHQALYALQALNLNYQVQGQAEFWTPILNAIVPEMDGVILREAVESLGSGVVQIPKRHVRPEDLIRAASFVMRKDRERNLARLQAEIQANGKMFPEGVENTELTLQWQRVAVETFLEGATREEAENTAWDHIGYTKPEIKPASEHQVKDWAGKVTKSVNLEGNTK